MNDEIAILDEEMKLELQLIKDKYTLRKKEVRSKYKKIDQDIKKQLKKIISWSETDYEMFKVVEPELVLFDKDGDEDTEWFNHFINCEFKEFWTAENLVEAIRKDKESKFIVEQVCEKYNVQYK